MSVKPYTDFQLFVGKAPVFSAPYFYEGTADRAPVPSALIFCAHAPR